METLDKPDKYDLSFFDITGNCNLRCPFCINDWSTINGNTPVSERTFEKILTLLPLLNSFYLSCYFEPTIHPDFESILKMIPDEHRKKVLFTTNLSKKLSDGVIDELSSSGFNYINISLDSLNPEVFEKMRRGARFDVFYDNLRRLTDAFSSNPKAPPLRYITILNKHNIDEIPKLIEDCATNYLSTMNELRTFVAMPHIDKDWIKDNDISLTRRDALWNTLYEFPHKWMYVDYDNKTEYDEFFDSLENLRKKQVYFVPPFIGLRISSGGIVELSHICIESKYDINKMDAPYAVFKEILSLHSLDMDRAREIKSLHTEKMTIIREKDSIIDDKNAAICTLTGERDTLSKEKHILTTEKDGLTDELSMIKATYFYLLSQKNMVGIWRKLRHSAGKALFKNNPELKTRLKKALHIGK
ncbi:radical SAM protein [Candidatus Magnetominusculus xianensis]|uniref:Radical SAM protein n=1 Tax=Candidatus Magnetominusculus xianensis TaxID=1748249 RepID=A0ABR5SKT3_9BACT|nr:radical SAM protein [Candidatus Magnetominusculus xianensis]KWT88553.1 radical SAM protein [Candidatus Magnetominusculus xianensis]MBF0404097.1 radical SAM protein [Nitrospirota bacterium]